MTHHGSTKRISIRRLLPLLGLVFVAWACSKSVTQDVGDAMIDAADALRDAGSTLVDAGSDAASAQTPTVIQVSCTQSAENTTMTTQLTQTTTVSYEWVSVADPRKVMIERCGLVEYVSCPTGGSCTTGIPVPTCRITPPLFENGQVFVECGRTQVVVNSMGVMTANSSQTAGIVRLLISP